jgi:urea carboxylase
VESPVHGNVWKVLAEPGMKIEPGQVVVVVESMKMEMMVRAVTGGVVREVLCRIGKTVQAGQRLLVLEQES